MNTRILMVSGDTLALKEGSAVRRRLRSYAQKGLELQVLVPTANLTLAHHEEALTITPMYHHLAFLRLLLTVSRGEQFPRPDLVTAQDPFFLGLCAWLIARHHRVPLELQVHTDLLSPIFRSWSIGNRIRVLLAQFLIPRAQHLRVVSERIADSLVARALASRERITVLPIAVAEHTAHVRHSTLREERRILTVARLEPEKRIDLALRALALASAAGVHFQYTIVGEGGERRTLERLARELGITHLVRFVGAVSDPRPYYEDADLYLSLSAYEGYGLSLVEAAQAGLPIISTDVGVAPLLDAHLVDPDVPSIVTLLQKSALSPARVPPGFIQSDGEYQETLIHAWEYCIRAGLPLGKPHSRRRLLLRYLIAGSTATAVDLGLLFVLTELLRLWYVLSAVFAYGCAFVVSFTLQKFWTFRDATIQQIHTQFLFYLGLGVFNMLLNALLIYVIVEGTGAHYLLAQIGIGLMIALWSFFCYRILFRYASHTTV